MTEALRFTGNPELRNPTLIVGWTMDAGRLGSRVTDHLISSLGAEPFCEIEPVDFFPLGGVTIYNDLILFPESRFYASAEKDVIIFKSTPPSHEWYRFLNLILDVALDGCHAGQVYTVGSMIAFGPDSAPRQFFGTMNSGELKEELSDYGLTREIDFQTPPGGRPTLNSFFLWCAKRRGLRGANLWVPVPFYLVSSDDPAAYRKPLEFLNHRLGLGMDLADMAERQKVQDDRMERLRLALPEADRTIRKLENSTRLTEGEGEKLARQVEEYLRENAG